jgi:hypothetical protein
VLLDSDIWGQRLYMRLMLIKISEWVKSENNNKPVQLGMIPCFMGSFNSSFYINILNYAAPSENQSIIYITQHQVIKIAVVYFVNRV